MASKVDNLNEPNPFDGWTPLHSAAWYGHTEIVKFLASRIENPNAPIRLGGWSTPLNLASRKNHLEVIETLLTVLKSKLKSNPGGAIINFDCCTNHVDCDRFE